MMARLGDVFEEQITGEWGNECAKNEAGTKVLRTTNFTSDGIIDFGNVVMRSISQSKVEKKRLRYGDIILEKSGGTEKTPVGRVVFCDKSIKDDTYLCNNFTQAMRVSQKVGCPRYVFYFMWYLHHSGKTDLLQNKTTGIRNLQVKSYLNEEIPLPSLEEQRRIAALLDKVSDLIAKRRAQLDKLDLLVKARFVEMFGDPFINSMTWERIKIKDAVTVEPQNGMYKPKSDYVTDGSGTPILRIDGFYDGVVTDFSSLKRLRCNDKEKQKYLLKENDIVINRVNSIEYLGKCAHITGLIEETVYESNMMRMHFNPACFNPVYVTYLLCSRFVYDQVINHAKKAVNQASINQKDVLDFDIYQPPLRIQSEFADFVNQVKQSKLTIQQSLDKLETLKKALMQQYFE